MEYLSSSSSSFSPKIALVHDFLITYGGAERVFQALAAMYPEAPIYTLLADEKIIKKYFPGRRVHSSFLQSLPWWLRRRYFLLLPFFPVATESLNLREFDLVITSSGAWSKGIVTRLHTRHIAYLHSPMRFVWDAYEEAVARTISFPIMQLVKRLLLSYFRIWDKEAAERPDRLIANSLYTRNRVEKYYRRKVEIIFPPALSLFEQYGSKVKQSGSKKYFLVVARLTASKKIDIVIEAFTKMELPLVVVGQGKEERRLRSLAGPNISFVGAVDDCNLAHLYSHARAVLQPSEEDFGLITIEALSFGTPVIAYDGGEAKRLVLPGKTGELFQAQTPEVLADGVRRFIEREDTYSKERMRETANRFSTELFQQSIRRVVDEAIQSLSEV